MPQTPTAIKHIPHLVGVERQAQVSHSAFFKLIRKHASVRRNAHGVPSFHKSVSKRQYMCLRSAALHPLTQHKYPHLITPKVSIAKEASL